MSLAQRVRDYRYSKGWGPDELASRASISRTALYQIESGKTELPRAGTLRRIALALDVSMETLLGLGEPPGPSALASTNGSAIRPRASGEWFPAEGAPLAVLAPRLTTKYDGPDGPRFGLEYGPGPAAGHDHAPPGRERELTAKLQEVLASPFGDAVARIVEEAHRLIPQAQARAAGPYDDARRRRRPENIG